MVLSDGREDISYPDLFILSGGMRKLTRTLIEIDGLDEFLDGEEFPPLIQNEWWAELKRVEGGVHG